MHRQVSSLTHFSLVIVLCLSIACQVIGVPVALYNIAGLQEVVESTQLEDAALVSEVDFSTPRFSHEQRSFSSASPHVSFTLFSIFRPPISSL